MGKIKREQPHVSRKSIRDFIVMLKWHKNVASQRNREFLEIVSEYDQEIPQSQTADNLEVFFMFFQYKMRYLVKMSI